MEVIYFLLEQLNNIINLLFITKTSFGVSFGAIIFGVFVIGSAMSLFARMFDIFPQDFSSLGGSKDYFKKREGISHSEYKKESADLVSRTRKHML